MAEIQLRKIATLIGRLETPIVLHRPFLKKHGCWIKVVGDSKTNSYPTFTPIGKVVKGEQRSPTILRGYRGYLKITCVDSSMKQAREKIGYFLSRRFLGSKRAEGYGKVKWLSCDVADYKPKPNPKEKKLKIRKGLGINYPKALQRLLITLMLHDFVHTKTHQSKIYEQITITDREVREVCISHHDETISGNVLSIIVKYYDGLAAFISRRTPYKIESRYDYNNGKIDFKKLVKELDEKQNSAYKLYNYIYQCEELNRIVESMEYGRNSLRNHLLLMVNLAINDYYKKILVIRNGKIKIAKKAKFSSSATEKDKFNNRLVRAKDAEMH